TSRVQFFEELNNFILNEYLCTTVQEPELTDSRIKERSSRDSVTNLKETLINSIKLKYRFVPQPFNST
ncbi:hypothetical protein ABMA75_12985, partial [Halobacteriovorax sp. ZH4_bin.1]|uniref:hypothetical protein n=1 Tax=unclassified Halobacteriovorax TaxID=2639665 RepID=UPI0037122CBB